VNEGLLPFKPEEDGVSLQQDALNLTRIQEERRLMYVGITRAQRSLVVSWSRKRKKGREMVSALPSRFIAEMALNTATTKEDPRAKLRALRAEFAQRVEAEKLGSDPN
jgi:ATP-dependent DNA helicase Rep